MFLDEFGSQSKLLARSLLCGDSGVRRAVALFHRQQQVNPDAPLADFFKTLCREEITYSDTGDPPTITVKPLVCLSPEVFKHNLLSFLALIHSFLPQPAVLRVLECLQQDSHPSPWVSVLMRQLERNLGSQNEEPLYTEQCSQRLRELTQRVLGLGQTRGWAKYFHPQALPPESQSPPCFSDLGTQRKRKSSCITLDSDDETGKQCKRIRTILSGSESESPEWTIAGKTSGKLEDDAQREAPAEELEPAQDSSSDALPAHIKACALQIKELLESQTEWDQSSMDAFKVLSDCEPGQVEMICCMLSLADLPEQALPKVSSGVLALSPDLSHSTAATLIKNLLLHRVQFLSGPASRCLVNTMTSLCGRYARPMCHALIGPVLEGGDIGTAQAELLNRLIESCLDSHYRLLVLDMAFKITWNEAVLSIIHTLLNSKPDLNKEVFTQLTEQLVSQGPQLTKSVNFAKIMLIVLTKYSSLVTAEHKSSLSGCLMINETFLKKSLQAALKRI